MFASWWITKTMNDQKEELPTSPANHEIKHIHYNSEQDKITGWKSNKGRGWNLHHHLEIETESGQICCVGFAIRKKLISQPTELPVGINKCLMTLHFKLINNQNITIISAYAPMLGSDDVKKLIYSILDHVLILSRRTRSFFLVISKPELDITWKSGVAPLGKKDLGKPIPMASFSWENVWSMVSSTWHHLQTLRQIQDHVETSLL